MPCTYTGCWHLGQGPSASWPLKSTGSELLSSSSFWPKSNSSLFSPLILRMAEKGRPILLRKPVSGPMMRSLSRVSTSGSSNCRPPGILVIEKSHWVQAKRL